MVRPQGHVLATTVDLGEKSQQAFVFVWGTGVGEGFEMPITEDMKLPSDAELTVEEVPVGYPYLKAGSFHLGKYCEAQNNEFMLCRHETRDPAKCLADGREVTNCTNKFFRQVWFVFISIFLLKDRFCFEI